MFDRIAGLVRPHERGHDSRPGPCHEGVVAAADDGDEPGQHQRRKPHHPHQRLERQEPIGAAVDDDQHQDRQPDHHEDERPLQQHAGRERGPEHRRQGPHRGERGRLGSALRALLGQIEARQHPHGGHHARQQHGVGGGEAGLDPEQDRARHHQAGEQRGAARHEGERRPIGQQHRPDGAQERGNPVEPDGGERPRHAERARGIHRAGLQPIDADRFLVAHLVLEPDVHIVPVLDHLLGGLREARLVAVDRRNVEEAGQEIEQRHQDQHGGGARMRARGKIQDQARDCPRGPTDAGRSGR